MIRFTFKRAILVSSIILLATVHQLIAEISPPGNQKRPITWGMAAGISTYYPDISTFNEAVKAIEDLWISEGYTVNRHSLGSPFSVIFHVNLDFRLFNMVSLLMDVGTNFGSKVHSTTLSASLRYHQSLPSIRWLSFFAGVGVAHYSLNIEETYGASECVGPDPDLYLEYIELYGKSFGGIVTAGAEFSVSSWGKPSIYGGYFFTGKREGEIMSYNPIQQKILLNLRSFIIGVRFAFILF